MNHKASYTLHLAAIIGMLHMPLIKTASEKEQTFYDAIAPSYLAMFPLTPTKKTSKKNKWDIPTLNKRDVRRIALNLLKKDDPTSHTCTNSITTPEVWENLDLFANQHQKPEKTVAGALKRTHTIAGEISLIKMLVRPTTDTSILKRRQELIKYLVENDGVYERLNSALAKLKDHEGSLYHLALPNDPILQPIFNQLYKSRIFPATPGGFMADRVLVEISTFLSLPFFTLLAGGLGLAGYHNKLPRWAGYGGAAFLTLLSGFLLFGRVQVGKMWGYIKNRMRSVSEFTQAAKKIRLFFIKDKFNILHEETKVLGYSNKALYKKMLQILSHKTFTSKSSFTDHTGSVLAALHTAKKAFGDLFRNITLIGMTDAYVSIATLVRERKNKFPRYCFVEYCGAQKPIIEAHDFWHPTIPTDRVVTNSLELGTPNAPRNLVITGANAGGKSTTMKALTVSLLMGQTFGIAPAQKFSFTPFARINSYMNITDDIQADRSLFRAELFRAQALLDEIAALKDNQFSFTILDEVLTGTERVEGEAGAYGIARRLADFPNAIVVLATHFPGLIHLEKDTSGIYKNMKVVVNIDEARNFHFPYQLFEGKSDQQVALDIIEKEGFDRIIIEKAKDVLNRPKHYLPTSNDI